MPKEVPLAQVLTEFAAHTPADHAAYRVHLNKLLLRAANPNAQLNELAHVLNQLTTLHVKAAQNCRESHFPFLRSGDDLAKLKPNFPDYKSN